MMRTDTQASDSAPLPVSATLQATVRDLYSGLVKQDDSDYSTFTIHAHNNFVIYGWAVWRGKCSRGDQGCGK